MSKDQTLKLYNDLPTIDLPAVEIFCEGNWNGDKYSGSDLQAIVDAFDKVGFEPTVKAGHADGQDNLKDKEYRKIFGAPALGYVSKVYRKGQKLLADLKRVPRNFANLIKAGTYKRVSSEIYWNYKDESGGKVYPRVLKSIAFLGAEIPALTNLKEVEALFHKNDSGLVYAYENGREYRIYEMEKKYDMTVAEKDGKWCVYKDGVKVSEHNSKDEAMAAMNAGGANDAPADKADKKFPFNKDKYENSKGEIHMTEAEVQAKLDAMRAEMVKDYEAKAEAKAADAVAKAKAEAETEKTKMAERIAELEKQNELNAQSARNATIDARAGKLKSEGKISPVEEAQLKRIFRNLPEAAIHVYSDADGKEVKEPVVESIWKLFESRNSTIFKDLAITGTEVRAYSDASAEVVKRANELLAKDEKLDAQKAYAQVAKSDPELWRKYQREVTGSH